MNEHERERLATLRSTSSSEWKISDFIFLMDALERAWADLETARTSKAKADADTEHWKGLVLFERDLHAKAVRERAEQHADEKRRIIALTGDAATAWNRIIAAKRDGRKTVRIADLLEGIDQ